MKTKNFLVSGVAGGITDFLLGWLFYGILFTNKFPQPDESNGMIFIALGCLAVGFFISYIYNKWAQITTLVTGAKAGAVIGFFMALISSFFNMAMQAEVNYELFAIELFISVVMTAIVGAVIGLVNGKLE